MVFCAAGTHSSIASSASRPVGSQRNCDRSCATAGLSPVEMPAIHGHHTDLDPKIKPDLTYAALSLQVGRAVPARRESPPTPSFSPIVGPLHRLRPLINTSLQRSGRRARPIPLNCFSSFLPDRPPSAKRDIFLGRGPKPTSAAGNSRATPADQTHQSFSALQGHPKKLESLLPRMIELKATRSHSCFSFAVFSRHFNSAQVLVPDQPNAKLLFGPRPSDMPPATGLFAKRQRGRP